MAIASHFRAVAEEHGFARWKTRDFARIRNGLLQFMNFQSSSHGTRDFCVNYSTIPLFMPHQSLGWIVGGRFPRGKSADGWWGSKTLEQTERSAGEIAKVFGGPIVDWFERTSSLEGMIRELSQSSKWLNAHADFSRGCCLAMLGRRQDALAAVAAARAEFDDAHQGAPDVKWLAEYVSHCRQLIGAIGDKTESELLGRWQRETVANLKLRPITTADPNG